MEAAKVPPSHSFGQQSVDRHMDCRRFRANGFDAEGVEPHPFPFVGRFSMVRYLSLMSFTDQGIRGVDQSCERARKFRAAVEGAGGKVQFLYWAVGEFDGAFAFEVPDEATATRLLLSLGKLGNVRTRSLRVYDESEFQGILGPK